MPTLGTLTTNVAAELGLNATDDQTQIWRRLNEAVRDVLRRTHCYVTTTTLATTAGTSDYQLDAGTLAITYAYVTGGQRLLEPTTPQDILQRRLLASTSDTSMYYALQGSNLLMLYPTPSASGTLTFFYVPQPTEMSNSSHDPSSISTNYGGVPDEYHFGLEYYACWHLASLRDDQSSSQGERYRTLYEGQDGRGGFIATMRRELALKAGVVQARAQVGRRRYRSSSPSADDGPWG
jgi:hypothetical protein